MDDHNYYDPQVGNAALGSRFPGVLFDGREDRLTRAQAARLLAAVAVAALVWTVVAAGAGGRL